MPAPPQATRQPVSIEQWGRVRSDPYAWLKDRDWQEVMRDPTRLQAEIRAHLEAENAFTEAVMADSKPLQAALVAEMRGRIKDDDWSPPTPDGPFEYFVRYAPGAEHPQHVRQPRGGGGAQLLLDEESLAQGKPYFVVGAAAHSPDHQLYAYAVDEQGSEYFTVRILSLATGSEFAAPIESCTGDFAFSPDGRFLFWTWRNPQGRPAKVFRRAVGPGPAADVLVYAEPDEGFFLSVGVTESRAFLVIEAGNQETSEAWVIPAAQPEAAPSLFARREPGVRYEPTHWDGRWYVRTNADGAVDFKIVAAEEGATERALWRDWLAHQPGRLIVGLAAYRDHLVRLERENALPRLVIHSRETGAEHAIAFAEEAFELSLAGGFEFNTAALRFVYQSPTTPRQWFDYDMAARARTLVKTQEVPSGHDPHQYEARRLFATAPDGARVPITLLRRRDAPEDGSAPVLLYGYGSYGVSIPAGFSTNRLSLVDRGWSFAIAHVRGGSELGWGWFLDGRREKKPNTFSDFIACAEHLVGAGLAQAGRIVPYGGSAGGLLVGAVLNARPELWGGAVAAVPFVDVLNTMSDASLPLTPPEWPEWGNPLESEAAYELIAGYSPYENVARKPYPPVLATGGLSDPRVTYWEPAKWVARLRELSTSARPILLKTNLEAGHQGASGRYAALEEIALEYAFALKCVGAAEAGAPI